MKKMIHFLPSIFENENDFSRKPENIVHRLTQSFQTMNHFIYKFDITGHRYYVFTGDALGWTSQTPLYFTLLLLHKRRADHSDNNINNEDDNDVIARVITAQPHTAGVALVLTWRSRPVPKLVHRRQFGMKKRAP